MIRVLVTGADGQLGKCFQNQVHLHPDITFVFTNTSVLDITHEAEVISFFKMNHFDFCINCAAYTQVDEAENHQDEAFAINADGVRHLALACKRDHTILIHISTDYVFDGEKRSPYTMADTPNPINIYGLSKLKGEKHILAILDRYYIIRTSWLYSEFGRNFYKTILQKASTEKTLYVTDEQTGCPTNANSLATYILNTHIKSIQPKFGLYHFTDDQPMTWYDFAIDIVKKHKLEGKVEVKKAKNYRTLAARPAYSVLRNTITPNLFE